MRAAAVPGSLRRASIALTALAVAGCGPAKPDLAKIAASEQIQLGSPEKAGDWPFWPTTLRFLDLSRSVASPAVGGQSLELYVECLDASGDTTKAHGVLVIELTCPTAEPTSTRFKIDLTSTEAQANSWDEITGSYRLWIAAPFAVPPPKDASIDCRAILFATDGRTPTATTSIPW